MRVAPINLAVRRNFQPQKNINFGKIEEKNREKIIDNLPFDEPCGGYKQEDADRDKEFDIAALDHNNGVMVKWGGKGHPRGLIYADLIREHVDRSPAKDSYMELLPETLGIDFLSHLENQRIYNGFITFVRNINLEEIPSDPKTHSSKSSYEDTYSEQEAREDNFIYGMFNRPL